jgi:uncharacterized protein YkwD
MTRALRFAVLAALSVALVVPAGASASSAPVKVFKRINKIRARHGLRKLHLSRSLERSARRYSRYQMRHGYFGHSSRIHASRRYRTLGEILEMHYGRKAAPGFAVHNWMHSSPHRSIILSRSFRAAGAGFAVGRFHGRRSVIWTMHFGRR